MNHQQQHPLNGDNKCNRDDTTTIDTSSSFAVVLLVSYSGNEHKFRRFILQFVFTYSSVLGGATHL